MQGEQRGLIRSLENEILGSIILKTDLIETTNLKTTDFLNRNARDTFAAIANIWETERPPEIDPTLLMSRLSDAGDGMGTYIGSLYDGNLTYKPEVFRAKTFELRKLLLQERISQSLKEGDYEKLCELADQYRRLGREFDLSEILKTGGQILDMNLKVDWLVEKLIPEKALTVLHAPGGMGKTFIALQIGRAIAEGEPIFGLGTTKRTCVFLDYENPVAILTDRIKKLRAEKILFWPLLSEPKPPLLDSDRYQELFNLPPESLIILDSLRSSHLGDENSSADMALIFNRLKSLREAGYSLFVLHHSPKADDRIYKGSTAISDLSDHTLAFFQVNSEFKEISTTELFPDSLYHLGSGQKTRYERYGIYLRFNGDKFELAESPDEVNFRAISQFLQNEGPKNQSELRQWIKNSLEIKNNQKIDRLLKRGEGRYWNSYREAGNKPRVYYAV